MNAIPSSDKVSKDKINFIWKNIVKYKSKLYTCAKCMEMFVRQSEEDGKIPTSRNATVGKGSKRDDDRKKSLPMYDTTLSSMKRLRYR